MNTLWNLRVVYLQRIATVCHWTAVVGIAGARLLDEVLAEAVVGAWPKFGWLEQGQ